MRYFIWVLIMLISGCAIFNTQTQISKDEKQLFVELEEFGLRTKPILNREYLIFLSWYVDVYRDYPDKVLEILPFNTPNIPDLSLTEMGKALRYPDTIFNPLLKNYTLNPKFMDYPLIGLSKHQILEMQKWMNDRYNENMLIDAEYLKFYSSAMDEDCFVTEAFLVHQWYASTGNKWDKSVKKEDWSNTNALYAPVAWQKQNYKPNFRLPYMSELIEIEDKSGLDNRLREYSFGKEDFLWKWNDHYLKVNTLTNKIWLNVYFYNYDSDKKHPYPFPVHFNKKYQLSKTPMTILTLEESEQQFNNIAYLKQRFGDEYFYPEKDSLGRMRFVIVGADKENRPLVADRIETSNEPTSNAIYRIVYNKTIDSTYLPLKE